MTFTTVVQIEAAPTADLIAFYNAHSTKPVKKFADRATALKRCIALMDECGLSTDVETEQEGDEMDEDVIAQNDPNAKDADEVKSEVKPEAEAEVIWPFGEGNDLVKGDNSAKADTGDNKESKPVIKKAIGRASNSEGVAASWADPSVAAARMIRDGVSVTVKGQTSTYKSTREAFRAFRLLDSKHIRFRGILKANKSATYTENGVDYLFAII